MSRLIVVSRAPLAGGDRRASAELRRVVLPLALLLAAACVADERAEAAPEGPGRGRAGPDAIGDTDAVWREGPRLPAPVSNNAVAAGIGPTGVTVLSFLGIDSTKTSSGVTNVAYRWDVASGEAWREIQPVPGPGRLAATAQVVAGRAFLFGGYTVAADGTERSSPNVDVYDIGTDSWGSAADMPIAVDDAVSGVWGRSLIYVVSGWRDSASVAAVQVFDPSINVWLQATPIPGAPVFGLSGAVAGDQIVYVGGARTVAGRPRFVADTAAWRGRIDPGDPAVIVWESIPLPPGAPLYRAAGGPLGGLVALAGGTANPYNYDGVGYDGMPSAPESGLVVYEARTGWVRLPAPPIATMDHRALAVAGGRAFLVGGMEEGQRVSDRVWYAEVDRLLAGLERSR